MFPKGQFLGQPGERTLFLWPVLRRFLGQDGAHLLQQACVVV